MQNSFNKFYLYISFFTFIYAFQSPKSFAQDYFEPYNPKIEFTNHIFDNLIKTVQFHKQNWSSTLPIYEMQSAEHLLLSFDDLSANPRDLQYTIVHCDPNWNPSDLMESEYINGVTSDFLAFPEYSRGTKIKYQHYELAFPNESMQPAISGNFILKVYVDSPENVVLTRRFYVVKPIAEIAMQVQPATTSSRYKHEFSLTTTLQTDVFINAFRNVKTVVMQNQQEFNALTELEPAFVKDNQIEYTNSFKQLFWAGNQFRNLNIKSLNYNSDFVSYIELKPDTNLVVTEVYPNRAFLSFSYEPDINGEMLIRNEDASLDSRIDGEYSNVKLLFEGKSDLQHYNLFVFGALTNWELRTDFQFGWNQKHNIYELNVLLKQGYYDFIVVHQNKETGAVDWIDTEGNSSLADQFYTAFTYYQEPGNYFYSLIGYSNLMFPLR